jgi:hypothetical protein
MSALKLRSCVKADIRIHFSILDYPLATTRGTHIVLPVATIDEKLSCRIFANYSCVGEYVKEQDTFTESRIRQKSSDWEHKLCD